MKTFWQYAKQYKGLFGLFVLVCAFFTLSFFLWELPLGAVAYPACLSAVCCLFFLLHRWKKEKLAHEERLRFLKRDAELMEHLPEPTSLSEADYQLLIAHMREEWEKLNRLSLRRYEDTVQYFTLWAHQIKTPIASMALQLQSEDTPLARELMGELRRIEQYADMVLTYLRLDGDGTDYVFRVCKLDDVIRKELRRFAPDFIRRKIRLDYTPTEETVVTDEKWLGFVIGQLLSNSLKYTREGGTVSLSCVNQLLTVRDTGIGIAPEDLPRIFDRGYTGLIGRDSRQATGIGLYLCKRICKELGVGISAESAPGVGTAIMLDLRQHDTRPE